MDRDVSNELREEELAALKTRSYDDLRKMIDHPVTRTALGRDGMEYQIEVTVFWDTTPGGDLRVIVAIDDGGWRAILPRSESFLVPGPLTVKPLRPSYVQRADVECRLNACSDPCADELRRDC